MDKEKIIRERFKVFEKLVGSGYNTDKKIIDIKIEDLIQLPNFNRNELLIAIGIKTSLSNRKLVTYLCGMETNEKQNEIKERTDK